jgi:FkbM family methyltransferase
MNQYIIDVGTSYSAPRGIELKKQYGLPVIFIEPNKSALDRVPAQSNDIKLNLAVTSFDGEIEFNYYQDGTDSILETNLDEIHNYIDGYTGKNAIKEKWTAWKKEKVKCMRLDSIINKHSISLIPHLKIDTQGHDFEVIKSAGSQINIIKYIECEVQTTEFEIYKNQSKKEELIKYMIGKNFELIGLTKQTFDQEENLTFENKTIHV